MCGIVGRFSFDRQDAVSEAAVRGMCDTIVHRGPDDEGVFVAGPVGLGMRRLSIIDLSGGHQPMQTADGRYTIVFNGEIYNYREVRRALEQRGCRFKTASDTECILEGFALDGPESLQNLNGMFTFAIWDARERQLFVARDRVGIKPLYWVRNGRGMSFASEIKALLTGDVPRELDADAFQYYLQYGYVASPATLLRAVRQLPPAHFLIARESGVQVHRYWSLPEAAGSREPDGSEPERVFQLVKDAVERQLVSDVPLGAFLSGGLDSSSMVHMMAAVTNTPVNTYSIGFAGGDAFHSELDDAKFIAQTYGTAHHEIVVRPEVSTLIPRLIHHMDQPIADSSFIVTYLVSQLARETVKVIISGVGGDELFGGYRRYLWPYLDGYYKTIPSPARRALGSVAGWLPVDRGSAAKNYFRLARAFLTADGLPAFDRYDRSVRLLSADEQRCVAPGLQSAGSDLAEARRSSFDGVPATDPVGQMQRLDFDTSLVDSLLQLTDKMTMAASLEARVPLLDHELIEAVTVMSSSVKIRRGELRYVQKASMRGKLPDRVFEKKKRGFGCPVGAWFRGDLRPLLRDTLSASALQRRGWLNAERVDVLIREHESQREDRTDVLLALLTFQLWCDEWNVV